MEALELDNLKLQQHILEQQQEQQQHVHAVLPYACYADGYSSAVNKGMQRVLVGALQQLLFRVRLAAVPQRQMLWRQQGRVGGACCGNLAVLPQWNQAGFDQHLVCWCSSDVQPLCSCIKSSTHQHLQRIMMCIIVCILR